VLKPYKAQILTGEELPTMKNTFGRLNRSFLEQSFVMPINDSSALVTNVGGHGSGHGGGCGDGGHGGRHGGCGDGRRGGSDGCGGGG